MGPCNPNSIGTRSEISFEFGPLQVKLWYHMSYASSIKMKEYVGSEFFVIFLSKKISQKYSAWVSGDPFHIYKG